MSADAEDFSDWVNAPSQVDEDFSGWVSVDPGSQAVGTRLKKGRAESLGRGLKSGAWFGFDDEAQAGISAGFETVFGDAEFKDFGDTYESYRDPNRKLKSEAAEDNPMYFGAGNVAGSIPTAIMGGAAALPARLLGSAKTLGGAVKQGAAGGALMGLGETAEIENLDDVATDVVKGAGLGLAGGAAGVALGKGLEVSARTLRFLPKEANEYFTRKAFGYNKSQIKKQGGIDKVNAAVETVRDLRDVLTNVGERNGQAGKVLQWNSNTRQMLDSAERLLKNTRDDYEGVMSRLTAANPGKMARLVDVEPIIKNLTATKRKLSGNVSLNSGAIKTVDNQIEELNKLTGNFKSARKAKSKYDLASGLQPAKKTAETNKDYGVSLDAVKSFKRQLDDYAYTYGKAESPTDTVNAQLIQNISKDLSSQRKLGIATLSESEAKIWREADKKFGALNRVKASLEDKLSGEMGNEPIGLTEAVALGGPGSVAGNIVQAGASRFAKLNLPYYGQAATRPFTTATDASVNAMQAIQPGLNRLGIAAPAYETLDPTIKYPEYTIDRANARRLTTQ